MLEKVLHLILSFLILLLKKEEFFVLNSKFIFTIKLSSFIFFFYLLLQIVSGQYEVDTMSCAGDNRFYVPSIKFTGDKVWYYLEDIKEIIPEPLPATSSARHFSVVPDIWAKYRKKTM